MGQTAISCTDRKLPGSLPELRLTESDRSRWLSGQSRRLGAKQDVAWSGAGILDIEKTGETMYRVSLAPLYTEYTMNAVLT
jgi:hypothetical protein